MDVIFELDERLSDSPLVEVVWHNRCERGGTFTSVALSHWQLVISQVRGNVTLTVRGPETKASAAYCPPEAEHFGIQFKHGVVMPHLPTRLLKDGMLDLPQAGDHSFWLGGSAWHYPNYDNADSFVARLIRAGLLEYDPVITAALRSDSPKLSLRTVQRRFLETTGLSHGTLAQIDRARQATLLLQQGVSILDTVDRAGYADQPHLTRSLKQFSGLTPAQLLRTRETNQLSFISKLSPVPAEKPGSL
jgi:AraC-like DNA-binding protein